MARKIILTSDNKLFQNHIHWAKGYPAGGVALEMASDGKSIPFPWYSSYDCRCRCCLLLTLCFLPVYVAWHFLIRLFPKGYVRSALSDLVIGWILFSCARTKFITGWPFRPYLAGTCHFLGSTFTLQHVTEATGGSANPRGGTSCVT
jgi:hypothetical protein